MKYFKRLLIATLFTLTLVVAVEGVVRLYVSQIARESRLFQTDAETGWRTIPNLRVTRLNAAAQVWKIETDTKGFRNFSTTPSTWAKTVLILGDSFAFGEGVNIEDRFDRILANSKPDLRVINTGTMGFGTDQEYVVAKPYLESLKDQDLVLLVFCENDFFDVLRKRFALRSKPYFQRAGEELQLMPPNITWIDWLRDESYLSALIARFVEPAQESNWNVPEAVNIIRKIISLIRHQLPVGTALLIAYHGQPVAYSLPDNLSGSLFCETGILCIDLNQGLIPDTQNFLPDGHWTPKGHLAVGRMIAAALPD